MRVTICELNDEPRAFGRDWRRLVRHVKREGSGLVLLPEMAFCPWIFWRRRFEAGTWKAAVKAHDRALERLKELAPAVVIGTRPINRAGKRHNEGFIWDVTSGYRAAHTKYYLPDEAGYREASWYQSGRRRFEPAKTDVLESLRGGAKIRRTPSVSLTTLACRKILVGFAICSDLWFFEHSRAYGKKGVHIIVCPRATPKSTVSKWLAAGRAAAVVSGAYSISSNRINARGKRADFGGMGWVVGPDGEVLALTSRRQPFVTLEIDLERAEKAKRAYPRYVKD